MHEPGSLAAVAASVRNNVEVFFGVVEDIVLYAGGFGEAQYFQTGERFSGGEDRFQPVDGASGLRGGHSAFGDSRFM